MAARRSPLVRGTVAGAVAVLLALVGAALLPHGSDRSLVDDGTDAVLVPHATSASCPLPASKSGLCGTVAGFSGWYGSWTTAGGLGAFCLEHAKSEPRPELTYARKGTARGNVSAPVETQQRLGYLLGRYGGTSDATQAAALGILVHAAEGDTLTTGDLGSYPTSLPAAVRASVLALWQEAAELHGPYLASLAVTGSGQSATGVLTLRSASGHPVPGMPVSWGGTSGSSAGSTPGSMAGSPGGASTSVTDAAGSAKLTVDVGSAGGTTTMHASVGGLPQDDFAVWIPADGSVQRVAVPLPPISVSAVGSWTAAPSPGSLRIVKHTDDQAFVSPAGAVFAVVNSAGATVSVVTAGADGTTPVVGSLAPGTYQVVEQTPCSGCSLAVAVSAAVAPGGQVDVVVNDHVLPHQLSLRKVTPDGQPLAGAVLHVRGQSAPGATYDQDLGTCTTGADGSCALTGGNALAPQGVQVTEQTPAPGTVLASPNVQTADLTAGDATVTFVDPRLVSVAFHKTDDAAGSVVDHAHESLAGAVFVVTGGGSGAGGGGSSGSGSGGGSGGAGSGGGGGAEVGRCTTGGDGTCTLAGSPLVEGVSYTWLEAVAPPGFALDPAMHSFTAASCGSPCVPAFQVAADAGRYAHVVLVKHAAGEADTPVPGAVVDLCAGSKLPAALVSTYVTPSGSACPAGTTWVSMGTSGNDGRVDFGLLPPGVDYCAVERTAPAGWQLAVTPVCGDVGPAGSLRESPPATLVLDLAEERTPVVPQAVTPAKPVPSPAGPTSSVPSPVRVATRVPMRTPRVAALSSTRPAAAPRTPAPHTPVGTAKPPELAYTGTEELGPLVVSGLGLVASGAFALLGAATVVRRRSRLGQQGSTVWGGWTPG